MGGATLPIIGGALGLLNQIGAAGRQRQATGQLKSLAQGQRGLFQSATPYYAPILQWLSGQAGVGPSQPGTPTPTSPHQPGLPQAGATGQPLPMGTSALPQSALGVYNNPAEALRYGQAEEDIGRTAHARAQELMRHLTQQGAGQSTIAAALARNASEADQGLAGFRRQQAIGAQSEQERRALTLLQALGMGTGAGGAAAGIYGNLNQIAAGQGAQGAAQVGDILQQYYALQQQKHMPYTGPGLPWPYGSSPAGLPGLDPWGWLLGGAGRTG